MITANELKMKGVSAIEEELIGRDEAIISVRGKARYAVLDLSRYDRLREHELELAWLAVKEDVATGRYREETAEEHITRVSAELQIGESQTEK